MEHDDLPIPSRQEPAGSALKQPEPPDTEAVEEHHDEGSGPFGADMQHVRGGTGTRQSDPQHEASPYSTGTNSATGASMSTADPRSAFAPERTGAGMAQRDQEDGGAPDSLTNEDTTGSPAAGENPDIRWDK
ncbi:hypothetical protein GCM10008955_09450 [Deinococcus malanensis]|uniref:Uncharacterized protein n=1 Tax=Deinococcus malanensis TaxID=1706855 RepID=A0ABQ2ESA4_9DEIO|nr:hypothetical protein [Deinococcus malanensis]GGK18145.1 hypothetical protein GCM10008955_09450 [Deinococcus malanensis]